MQPILERSQSNFGEGAAQRHFGTEATVRSRSKIDPKRQFLIFLC